MSIGLYGYTMEIVRRRDSIVRVSASWHARPQISPGKNLGTTVRPEYKPDAAERQQQACRRILKAVIGSETASSSLAHHLGQWHTVDHI